MPNPVMLMVLDGFGINSEKKGNAIQLANGPTLRKLEKANRSQIYTSGGAVGLPDGQMGNSEVGHMNLGSGRIVYQDFTRINKSINEGDFFNNILLKEVFAKAKKNNANIHYLGLVSDGGVHSHIKHLFALLAFARKENCDRNYVHCFLDGRDTHYQNAHLYLQQLEVFLAQNNYGKIASISGRYYAMDRDKRWNRIKKVYDLLTEGKGLSAPTSQMAIQQATERGETDEFVLPTLIDPKGLIKDNDIVIFFNFRADRARQLTITLTDPAFDGFDRSRFPKVDLFITMTQYHKHFPFPAIFPPTHLTNVLGEILSKQHIPQLRIAETEKYAHVTFFFNGGEERLFEGEERLLIPSPRNIATYDLKPEMSAPELTHTVIKNIESKNFGFILLNFANADMVGHTGSLPAAIRAVEVLDECIEKILNTLLKNKGHLLITADHGNIEQMINYETGEPHTAHTTNPVPFYYIHPDQKKYKLNDGVLADFMPTVLKILNLPIPMEVTGNNLIVDE